MGLHDAATVEQVQGFSPSPFSTNGKSEQKGKRQSPYLPIHDYAAEEEDRLSLFHHEDPPSAETNEEAGKEEETPTSKPSFGFDPHPKPKPTAAAAPGPDNEWQGADNSSLPSFIPHTAPSITKGKETTHTHPTSTPDISPAKTPHDNATLPTSGANGDETSWADVRWPRNPLATPLFWGVGVFYLGFAYWEGWQQARGEVGWRGFVDEGVKGLGERL